MPPRREPPRKLFRACIHLALWLQFSVFSYFFPMELVCYMDRVVANCKAMQLQEMNKIPTAIRDAEACLASSFCIECNGAMGGKARGNETDVECGKCQNEVGIQIDEMGNVKQGKEKEEENMKTFPKRNNDHPTKYRSLTYSTLELIADILGIDLESLVRGNGGNWGNGAKNGKAGKNGRGFPFEDLWENIIFYLEMFELNSLGTYSIVGVINLVVIKMEWDQIRLVNQRMRRQG